MHYTVLYMRGEAEIKKQVLVLKETSQFVADCVSAFA